MFCNECGKQIKDGSRFCPYCGSQVRREERQPVDLDMPPHRPASSQESELKKSLHPKPSKKKKTVILILCVSFFLIALFAGGFYAYQNGLLDGTSEKVSDEKDSEKKTDILNKEEVEEENGEKTTGIEADQQPADPKDGNIFTEEPAAQTEPYVEPEPYNRQEILVVCSGSTAQLSLNIWEDDEWKEVLLTHADIGANGISAQKQEGDRCTPLGTYDVLFCFSNRSLNTKLACIQVQKGDVWVCDPDSIYYNTLQNNSNPEKDWDVSENMYDKFADSRSSACIYFAYNGDGQTARSAAAYGGSALFLDGVGSSGKMTSGYGDIKISATDMATLLEYLDAEKQPIITIR